MNLLKRFGQRLRSLRQQLAAKRKIDEGSHFHLEERTAASLASGMTLSEAGKQFGNIPWGTTVFLIMHSSRPGAFLAPGLRDVVAKLDPDLPLARVRTFKTIVREAAKGDRGIAAVTNFCMVMSIGLAAIGLYGMLSYHVLQRTREIGVRMALGAARRDVLRMVFQQGFGWVLIGMTIGVGGVLASATSLRAMLYDINSVNPLSLAASTGAVALAATLACWLPACWASRVQPWRR